MEKQYAEIQETEKKQLYFFIAFSERIKNIVTRGYLLHIRHDMNDKISTKFRNKKKLLTDDINANGDWNISANSVLDLHSRIQLYIERKVFLSFFQL